MLYKIKIFLLQENIFFCCFFFLVVVGAKYLFVLLYLATLFVCWTSIVDVVGSTTEPFTRGGCLTRLVYFYVKLNKRYKLNPSPFIISFAGYYNGDTWSELCVCSVKWTTRVLNMIVLAPVFTWVQVTTRLRTKDLWTAMMSACPRRLTQPQLVVLCLTMCTCWGHVFHGVILVLQDTMIYTFVVCGRPHVRKIVECKQIPVFTEACSLSLFLYHG